MTDLVGLHFLLEVAGEDEGQLGILIRTLIQQFLHLQFFLFGIEKLRYIIGNFACLFVASFREDKDGKFGLIMEEVLSSLKTSCCQLRSSCCTPTIAFR